MSSSSSQLQDQASSSYSSDHTLANFTRPQKRSARMHAESPRKKLRTASDNDTQLPLPTALDQTPPGTVKRNIGDCPPYNDHSAWIEDGFNNTVYMFGGTRPRDEDCIPTSDFYRCDSKTMKFEDLTEKLRFRDPSDPLCCTELLREKKPLPELSGPGLTLMRVNNTSIILIFGGYSLDEEKAVSTLIAVDVDHLEWWYVTVEGGQVAARINPVVVAVEQKIYIFSGFKKFSTKESHTYQSYSIASYSSSRRWQWEARDVPYSGLDHQVFGAGMPVYDGKKILLTPGRVFYQEDLKPLDFSKLKLLFFHTDHRQFHMVPHFGDFPKVVLWYSIHKPPPSRPPLPSRRLPNRASASGPSTPLIPGPSTSLSSPFIIICAWIPRHNSRYAVPEFWRLSLSHNDEIRCLNKSDKIWDLNHDFQGCISTKEGITLLGNNNPKGEEHWNIHLRIVLTSEDYKDK